MEGRIGGLEDYRRLRQSFSLDCPERFNFAVDVVDKWAEAQPERPALHWVSAGEERVISYARLSERSNRAASALRTVGLQQGDHILIVLPRIPEWWEVVLGAFKAGMVAMPGTVLLTPDDFIYRINASEASAIITDAAGAAKVDSISAPISSLRTKIIVNDEARETWHSYDQLLDTATADLPPCITRSDAPALIYFTSGTTGYPKMVLHSQAGYGIGHQITGRLWLDLRPGDLHWNISDTGWAKAAWSSFFGPFDCGATVFVQHSAGKFHPEEVLATLAQYPIRSLCAPPTIYRMLVQQDLRDFQARSLRSCVSAGEPLNPEVIEIWKQSTGITIRDGYGQTESVLLCGNFPGVPVKPGSMGLPSPGFELGTIDEHGNSLPAGQEGDIAVRIEPQRPVGLFVEYYRNPEATREATRAGWYVTGDRGYVDEDGYVWFVGRADDVITSAAYRIGPFEVESALVEHPAVMEAAVVGKPDPTRGEIVKAFVVLAPGHTGDDAHKRELQEHVKQKTAPYKYPREIEFLPELPKTISGKIRRIELRRRET